MASEGATQAADKSSIVGQTSLSLPVDAGALPVIVECLMGAAAIESRFPPAIGSEICGEIDGSMAYLMDIALDNAHRLRRKSYLFEYQGFRFKLVQDNPRKWSDHLLTIVPQDDHALEDRAFMTAAEFASALSWAHGGL